MNEFNTYDNAEKLFEKLNCIGYENIIFVAKKDVTTAGIQAGLSGSLGVLGSVASQMVGKNELLQNLKYEGLLLNHTENGIGVIPLDCKGVSLTGNLAKLDANLEQYFFISKNEIDNIVIKNYNFLNHKLKKVCINLKNGQNLKMVVPIKEKTFKYQELNFVKFMRKYDSKNI